MYGIILFALCNITMYYIRNISRGGAVWQLAGLITRRSEVQILPPQPNWSGSVVVNMSHCHCEDRGFESRPDRHIGSVAQSVEQRTENPRVGGSIPPGTTIQNIK